MNAQTNTENIQNAVQFLNHANVVNASAKEKRKFLEQKSLSDSEISKAFEIAKVKEDDEDNEVLAKSLVSSGDRRDQRSSLKASDIRKTNNGDGYGVKKGETRTTGFFSQSDGGLRWTQVVACASAIGVLSGFVAPKIIEKYYWQRLRAREEEEGARAEVAKRRERESEDERERKLALAFERFEKNLEDMQRKLERRQETTESAVLLSVGNVERRMREELEIATEKLKIAQVQAVSEQGEKMMEELEIVRKEIVVVERNKKERKNRGRRSVEATSDDDDDDDDDNDGNRSSPSRRLGTKGYVAERVESYKKSNYNNNNNNSNNNHNNNNNKSNSKNKNNEDLDLDDYFQAKKEHQEDLLGETDDMGSSVHAQQKQNHNNNNRKNNIMMGMSSPSVNNKNNNNNYYNSEEYSPDNDGDFRSPSASTVLQQQERGGGGAGKSATQPSLEDPPRPKNFLEVIELVERGEPVPGIKDIDDRPPNPNVPLPPASEDLQERTRKPWAQMKSPDDESFEGHRPWAGYGDGASTSGAYLSPTKYNNNNNRVIDEEEEEEEGGNSGWTPPSIPTMSVDARAAFAKR